MTDLRDLLQEAVGSFEPRGDERSVEGRVRRRHRRQQRSAAIVALGLLAAGGLLAWTALRPAGSTLGSTGSASGSPGAREILVPDVVGLPPAEARASLDALGLTVFVATGTSDQVDPGLVAAQEPPAGVAVAQGTSVTIVVNGGAPVAAPVPLGDLPDAGVAISSAEGVQLVALDGTTVATLPGYALAGNPGAPGVWLQRGDEYFLLNVDDGALVPVAADEARAVFDNEGPGLPPSNISASGQVRYTVESPSGITLLEFQWSGQCEAAMAYWIDRGSARILTGDSDPASAPESIALGWSSDGDAIALVGGSCRPSPDQPGIYRYSAPGQGRLVAATDAEPVTVDAWGTGI